MDSAEELANLRKRLIFRSWHRGTREMDLILGHFADRHVKDFSPAELDGYEQILTCSDPDIYDWLCGRQPIPESSDSAVLRHLIDHSFQTNRTPR